MSRYYVLDADGVPQPCADLAAWGTWYASENRLQVDGTVIGDVCVSTRFIGLDLTHSLSAVAPRYWETMTSPTISRMLDVERCGGLRADAQAQHDRVVAALREVTP